MTNPVRVLPLIWSGNPFRVGDAVTQLTQGCRFFCGLPWAAQLLRSCATIPNFGLRLQLSNRTLLTFSLLELFDFQETRSAQHQVHQVLSPNDITVELLPLMICSRIFA